MDGADPRMTAVRLDGWVPAAIFDRGGQPMVDWVYVGDRPFSAPFFDQSIREALRHPFQVLFRHETPFEALHEWHALSPGIEPTGFIFHMSRCGSTLLTQLLAASPRVVAVSEAAPIDAVLGRARQNGSMSDHGHLADLRAIISALGQPRRGGENQYFVKFDCWHAMDLPLIRQAFPKVPWVFVYRHPDEVLVSQMTKPSSWMSGALLNERLDIVLPMFNAWSREDVCARVLAGICGAALAGLEGGNGNGRAVAYGELPDAVWTSLADHFGVGYSTDEIDRMKQSALLDSKTPQMFFADDRETKQRGVTPRIREASSAHLDGLYDRLEAFRGATTPGAARAR
jgi:hypothetical protein